MNASQVLFLIFAAVTLGSALMVVTTRKMIHAAFWLIATLFGVAALYALLNAGFIAMVQIVVYVGAIAILFIFAVMLTRKDLRDAAKSLNANWGWAAIIALLVFSGFTMLLRQWDGFGMKEAAALPAGDMVAQLGEALVSPNMYLLPFEVASVLLLAALIGAVYVAASNK